MSKRVLLTNGKRPKWGESPLHYGDMRPPLGLGFLAAQLEKHGHDVMILDNYIMDNDLEKEITSYNPDYIGIYVHTISYKEVLKLIDEIRQITPVPIMCGGPHATILPETLENKVDYTCIGEGEHVILDIVERRASSKRIKGEPIQDLDSLPWPDYRHFIDKPYNWKLDLYELEIEPVFTMNTSRGCPFHCQFCGVASIWGRTYRTFSARKIFEEIMNLSQSYGAKGIYFREDNFTLARKRLDEFCDLIIQSDVEIIWACESRVDTVDRETLEKMYQSGCRGLYIGVESGSQRVLDRMKKGITVKQIEECFKHCREIGISTYATFVFGSPGETEEDRRMTEELIEKIRPTAVDRFVYIGIPFSPFYRELKEMGQYTHIDDSFFLYPKGYRELIERYYGRDDPRYVLLTKQLKELDRCKSETW